MDVVVLAQGVSMNQKKESFLIIFIYEVNASILILVKDEYQCICGCVSSSGSYIAKSVILCNVFNKLI